MTTSPITTLTDELLAEIEADYMTAATMRADRDECLMIAAMAAELRTLRAQNAELAMDAERYRWLRDKCESYGGGLVIAKVTEYSIESWSGDDPDTAIDTAMQAQK